MHSCDIHPLSENDDAQIVPIYLLFNFYGYGEGTFRILEKKWGNESDPSLFWKRFHLYMFLLWPLFYISKAAQLLMSHNAVS